MALQKQAVPINFAQGLDQSIDAKQLQIGKFLALQNSNFNKAGRLTKRNGYGRLASLPDDSYTTLTTYTGGLVALGNQLSIYSENSDQWFDKGPLQSIDLSVLPAVRSATPQTACDSATDESGLTCVLFIDSEQGPGYQIIDSTNGQVLLPYTLLPADTEVPRVFKLGRYFIITYLVDVSAVAHLKYIAIPVTNFTNPSNPVDLSSQVSGDDAAYDGVVANNNLYLAFNASDGGGAIRLMYVTQQLAASSVRDLAGETADLISLTADTQSSTPVIWLNYWDGTDGWAASYSQTLAPILAPAAAGTSLDVAHMTSYADSDGVQIFYEIENNYSYTDGPASNYITSLTVSPTGTASSPTVIARSVGLASKAFYLSSTDTVYMLAAYGGALQPTYFLIDADGNVLAKLAYSNGGGYPTTQVLPSPTVDGTNIKISYLYQASITSVNKTQGADIAAAVYTQLGVNLANFDVNDSSLTNTEIGGSLNVVGGILWQYDGVKPVEQGFHLWPEDVHVETAATGGYIGDSQYYYAATYEWTDATGRLHRSAPSIPVVKETSGSTSSNTVTVPTLRLTYKTENPVRIVIYRWSTAQQTYYQVTPINEPVLNNPAVDTVDFVDTLADASIIGNAILYTTGGVLENIGPPACTTAALFKSRLFLIPAEDEDNMWLSKQVIQNTPVEMSDLLVKYIAPTTGAQGSTGKTKVLVPMDDKLIAFKPNAIYYMTGTGPDNTGANDDLSEPIFITSTVGCSNQQSAVFIPQGLMFQSNKGIWLLGRDLSTKYIGQPVKDYNNFRVLSAVNVPDTNQVRFTLDNGVTLMYDYYQDQWGTFNGIPGVSSTIFENLHTYVNSYGHVRQETPGSYLDGSSPVLLKFTTSWINLAGLQGFERAYFFQLLGEYISPHKLAVSIAYDYAPTPSQTLTISPDNFNELYGDDPLYGNGTPFGGNPTLEQWQVFFTTQKCQSFQITIQELFDATKGAPAGAGLTLSGLNLVVGLKKGYAPFKASRSAG